MDDFKANVGTDPWRTALSYLKNSYYASLGYTPQGPVEVVSRTPDTNRYPYIRDAQAIYELSLHGYITNSTAHLEKAKNLASEWAVVHQVFGGAEIYLEIGDMVPWVFGGFEILRMAYKDNITFVNLLQNYTRNLYKNGGGVPIYTDGGSSNLRGCNQGAAQISQQLYTAVFLDDEELYNQTLDAFLTHSGCGIYNSLPNGQLGDYGRDKGHAKGQLLHTVRVAEILWTQGVDVYSLLDNRILHAVEYWLDFFYLNKPREYIHHGCQYDIYGAIGGGATSMDETPAAVAYSAYNLRMKVSTPVVSSVLPNLTQLFDASSIIYFHSYDNSTARKPKLYWQEAIADTSLTPDVVKIATLGGGNGNYSYK